MRTQSGIASVEGETRANGNKAQEGGKEGKTREGTVQEGDRSRARKGGGSLGNV